jgi:Immunity protein 31
MAAEPRCDFYEKVVVSSADPTTAEIDGGLGAVVGQARGDDGRWSYADSMDHGGVCWSCWEGEAPGEPEAAGSDGASPSP